MADEPRLRAVEPPGPGDSEPGPIAAGEPGGRDRTVSVVLAIALVITLTLLAWSRAQLGQRIEGLQSEVAQLREAVEAREAAIAAQEARLGRVRDEIQGVLELLDRPLGDPAARR